MHNRSLAPARARRPFRTLSDEEALRASQALQQLAAGLADEQFAEPQPTSATPDRSTPSWPARHTALPTRPRPLR